MGDGWWMDRKGERDPMAREQRPDLRHHNKVTVPSSIPRPESVHRP
jgi:hypothetical protein